MGRPSIRLSIVLTACARSLAACGGDTLPPDTGPYDSGTIVRDTGADSARDSGADVRTDTGVDAGSDVPVRDVPMIDAARDSGSDTGLDVGPRDTGVDAGTDTRADVTVTDAPRPDVIPDVIAVDVGPRDVGPADVPVADAGPTGRCTPIIDGTVGTDWTSAAWRTDNSIPTAWVGNELRSIRVCFDAANLYFGIDGQAEAMNAIALYLDRDDGAATGITTPGGFMDRSGPLDSAISATYTVFPAGLGVDWAWGTRGMLSKPAGVVNGSVGLRQVGTSPTDFGWIGDDTTACSVAGRACEVSIPWLTLYPAGRPAGARLALFVRLVNGDGTMFSTQALPQERAPMAVTQLVRFTVP